VRLPLQRRATVHDVSAEPSAPRAPERWAHPAPLLPDVSVLIVDDEPDTRDAMAIGLGRHGARVATAASAGEAVATLTRERPQVLVTDIGMAGEDGYSLLRRVRALPAESGGETLAIALTGYANQQDQVDALRAGFQLHVSKPVTPAELAAAVASLIDQQQPKEKRA
jgi:CheY-like chemotaxis protein